MRLLFIVTLLFLSACTIQPNMETGEGCWRYGVLESGNTGKMANLGEVPVIKLGYDDMLAACGTRDMIRGCYQPMEKKIYVYKLDGSYVATHEKCHVLLGIKHNECGTAYGIGEDESACNWMK